MKKKNVLVTLTAMAILALANPASAKADELPNGWDVGHPENGWYEYDGKQYWYENGVLQGTEGRGKEIYDPASDAWYWLDAVQGGAVAKSKDVYQESFAGGYADREDGTGKWVRYDENGHMVKGWQTTDAGTYYFDMVSGAMAKGIVQIDGYSCTFDLENGIFVGKEACDAPEDGWYVKNGAKYWYEDGVRQGLAGRGKEIYDPASDAWYWLDAVDNGKMAVSKDVYQESFAGRFADREDGTGKWCRYDANGHMVKGWDETEAGKYYFDEETGAMAKGWTQIDNNHNGLDGWDTWYKFDATTGLLLKPSREEYYEEWQAGIAPSGSVYIDDDELNDEPNTVYAWDSETEEYVAVTFDSATGTWISETGENYIWSSNGVDTIKVILGSETGNGYILDEETGEMVEVTWNPETGMIQVVE